MKMIKNILIVLIIKFVTITVSAQSNGVNENLVLGECITGDCENGYGVFIYPNKNKYIGQFMNSLKNGFGVEIDPEGNYIYGDWKDNKEDGFVRIFNINDEIIFSGEMLAGKPVKRMSSNGMEDGCVIGDCENGFGHYFFENGDKYIGEWENGVMQGFCTYHRSDKSKYVGEFIAGQFSGYGAEYDADGQFTRKGKYINGAFELGSDELEEREKWTFGNCGNGFGIRIIEFKSEWERGYKETKNDYESNYEGIWLVGFRNNVGYYEDEDGNTYVGEFTIDKFQGKGVATFANGDMYNGSFEKGKMTGFGTMTYADGSKYVGEWNYNDKEGNGKEYDANGKLIYSGEFYNNERDD